MLCVLLELDYPLNTKIVTNIIYFYSWSVHFSKYFDYFLLTKSFGLDKTQNLLLYFKYSVLSEHLNNSTPSFKESNLVGII